MKRKLIWVFLLLMAMVANIVSAIWNRDNTLLLCIYIILAIIAFALGVLVFLDYVHDRRTPSERKMKMYGDY